MCYNFGGLSLRQKKNKKIKNFKKIKKFFFWRKLYMISRKSFRRYFGYMIIDRQVKSIVDQIRQRYPDKFIGILQSNYRGYRWKVHFYDGDQNLYLKRRDGWVLIDLRVIYGQISIQQLQIKQIILGEGIWQRKNLQVNTE